VKTRDEILNSSSLINGNDKMTAELEINDYGANVRSKMINKDYLSSIYDLTGC